MNPSSDNINDQYRLVPDEELVRLFHSTPSNHSVFYEIVRRYKQKVYFHIRRIVLSHDDADDAAQTTFIKVWENLSTFRGDSALFSWIYRIATNEALRVLKSKKPGISMHELTEELADLIDHSVVMDGDEIQKRLQKELLRLPDKQRIVFHLKYFDDLTYEKIAEITGTSIGALKASYFHAIKKLENLLQTPD